MWRYIWWEKTKYVYFNFKSGCDVMFSKNKIIICISFFIFSSNFINYSIYIHRVIQAFLFAIQCTWRCFMATFLKQQGFLDLPIIRGFSNSLIKFMHNLTVNISLDFFPELSFLKLNIFLRRTLLNVPVSSTLKILQGS